MSNEYKDWQAEEIKDLEAQVEKWINDYSDLAIRMAENDAKVEHVKRLIKLYRYDHGSFPYDTLMAALEGEQE